MNNQENSELIEVVLGLLEKSKQQDESIQKAIQALEYEQNALKSLRNDLNGSVVGLVGEGLKNGLDEHTEALKSQINRINHTTNQLQQAKKDLDWRSNLWYFGGLLFCMVLIFGFALWFIPSFDEIGERRAELSALTAKIEKAQNLQRLQTSNCDKRLCVKVIESKCNYGSKGNRYCVVDLK